MGTYVICILFWETSRPWFDIQQLCPCSSYTYEDDEGVFPECQFVFDLQLPLDFKPKIGDGEVQDFYFYPIEKVNSYLRSLTTLLITIDGLIRWLFWNDCVIKYMLLT